MNFVGYYDGPYMDIVHAIHSTFRSVFQHVRLFREIPVNDDSVEEPVNLVFYGSSVPITFSFPKYERIAPGSYYEVHRNENDAAI